MQGRLSGRPLRLMPHLKISSSTPPIGLPDCNIGISAPLSRLLRARNRAAHVRSATEEPEVIPLVVHACREQAQRRPRP
jgi:hypothetical protein